jgi:nucleotide-binding universal stress UspA family protein
MVCLVAVDGSDGSRSALRWGYDFAAATGDRLCVVRAWEYSSMTVLPGQPLLRGADEVDALVAAELGSFVTEELGAGADQVDVRVERGPADFALLQTAKLIGAETIIIGKRGLGAVAGRLLGSVSRRVAEHAPCPVVIVPPGAVSSHGPILVGLDGSANASAAVAWATRVAHATGTSIIAVHAYNRPPFRNAGYVVYPGFRENPEAFEAQPGGPSEVIDHLRDDARATVDRQCEPIVSAGVTVVTVIEANDPRGLIEQAAVDTDARMIVVGARGAGPMQSMLLGSVATYLTQHCERPVAIVPWHRPDDTTTRPGER